MIQTTRSTGFRHNVRRISPTENLASIRELESSQVRIGSMIPEQLAEEPRMVLVEGNVIQISKQQPDGWAFGTKLQHADEALSRQLVVMSTARNAEVEDSLIPTDTGWFELSVTRLPTGDDLAMLQSCVGDAGELDPPTHWDSVVDPAVAQLHVLPQGITKRYAIEMAFLSTLSMRALVVRVERIQNLAMWQSYVVKRQTICYRETEQSGKDDPAKQTNAKKQAVDRFERRWLWHGTNVEVKDKILQQGFNRSFCDKNATVYVKGVYFARDASYSADPSCAVRASKGLQYMLACRIMVGEYSCRGRSNALTPDIRDVDRNMLYGPHGFSVHGFSVHLCHVS